MENCVQAECLFSERGGGVSVGFFAERVEGLCYNRFLIAFYRTLFIEEWSLALCKSVFFVKKLFKSYPQGRSILCVVFTVYVDSIFYVS